MKLFDILFRNIEIKVFIIMMIVGALFMFIEELRIFVNIAIFVIFSSVYGVTYLKKNKKGFESKLRLIFFAILIVFAFVVNLTNVYNDSFYITLYVFPMMILIMRVQLVR